MIGFINKPGSNIEGYEEVFYNGLSTVEVCKVLKIVMESEKWKSGLMNLSGERINKANLLRMVNKVYSAGVNICSVNKPTLDRTLNSDKFREMYNYKPPSWEMQLNDLKSYKEHFLV